MQHESVTSNCTTTSCLTVDQMKHMPSSEVLETGDAGGVEVRECIKSVCVEGGEVMENAGKMARLNCNFKCHHVPRYL